MDPRMTLTELRYLVAAAELRNFSRAAEKCHVTQSTLSTQLGKLEKFLGVTLFERTSRSIALTPIGGRIVARARHILEEAEQICELARQDEALLSGALRLGIIPTLSPYLLPLFLRPLHESYPGFRLLLREDTTDNLLRQLGAYEVDVLLLALPGEVHGLSSLALFDEPFWLACPPGHKLAAREAVAEPDLAGEKLLLLEEGHCLREQALAVCGEPDRADTAVADDVRATSLETVCEMVAAGLGCTLLPALAVPRLAAPGSGIEVRPLRMPEACRRIGLMWRRSFPRRGDLAAFGNFVRAHLPPGVRPAVPRAAEVSPVRRVARRGDRSSLP
jgi:LysR family hydrogen peroxide-inducible transcriptional activator